MRTVRKKTAMSESQRHISKGRQLIESMRFPNLDWHIPRIGQEVHRTVLANGLVLYTLPDHSLPLFNLDFRARGGALHEKRRSKRMASVAQSLLRTGGTERHAPDEFDELLDFHGLTLQGQARLETTALSCWGLAEKLPVAVDMAAEAITSPRFDPCKLTVIKEQWREALRRRDDDPTETAGREFSLLLYGDDPQGWDDSWEDIEAFTVEDIRAWHKSVWDPGHCYLAASGDFDEARLIDILEARFADWPRGCDYVPDIPALKGQANEGIYLVPRVGNQSCICMGMLGVDRFDAQLPAIKMANYIFGAGSFFSRLMDKVRTREGLAYSIYSGVDLTLRRRGRVVVSVQTRTEATQRVMESVSAEMEQMRSELVSAAELEQAREALINSTYMAFADTEESLSILMQLEIIGWPEDYYENLLQRYKEVTREEIREVSARLYRPQEMLTVVVGDKEKLAHNCPQSSQWRIHETKRLCQ